MSARGHNGQQIVVGFGSNICPAANLPLALSLLRERLRLTAVSKVWESPPVGAQGADFPDFYNAVAVVWAPFSGEHLKQAVLRPLEAMLGRVRSADVNAPRPIDLDVLVEGSRVVDDDVWQYAHWAVPLAEVAPGLRHPATREPLAKIARALAARTPLRVVALPAWQAVAEAALARGTNAL